MNEYLADGAFNEIYVDPSIDFVLGDLFTVKNGVLFGCDSIAWWETKGYPGAWQRSEPRHRFNGMGPFIVLSQHDLGATEQRKRTLAFVMTPTRCFWITVDRRPRNS